MRRRLRLMALAISLVAIAAFLVPLLLALRHNQRTTTLSAADRTAAEVSAVAASLGDDPTRLQNYFASAYGGSRFDVTVWYPDGRGLVLSPAGRQAGVPPRDVQDVLRASLVAANMRTPVAGGMRLVNRGPLRAAPLALDEATQAPVAEVFVPTSAMTDGLTRTYLWFGAIALVIVLASLVMADRVAAMRPPPSPTRGRLPGPAPA